MQLYIYANANYDININKKKIDKKKKRTYQLVRSVELMIYQDKFFFYSQYRSYNDPCHVFFFIYLLIFFTLPRDARDARDGLH